MNLSKNTKVTQVLGYFTAAQTTRDSSILDMDGYEGVVFIALFGTLLENGTIKLSADQNTANSASGMAELAGSSAYTVLAADVLGSALVLDVYRPEERYVRASIDIGVSNALICGIVAIQYCAGVAPPTTGALQATTLISPAEA